MLKGLEISEVQSSELNAELRLDAEYFSKTYIEANKRLAAFGTTPIGDCVTDGIHTSIDYDPSSPVRLISAMSPQENVFDLSRNARISEAMHKANPRTALRKGDVIVSTVGTIGNCAVVDDSVLPANCDRDVGIIRRSGYSPYVLATFLLTRYGRAQTVRESTGNVQLHLFIYKMRGLKLPNFSPEFQVRIESLVKAAHGKIYEADKVFHSAEQMLLAELGFAGWSPTDDTVSVKSYSDFVSAGRFDAEHFQPKFDELFTMLSKCKVRPLGGKDGLVDIQRSIEPGSDAYSDKGVPFVRIADFTEMGITPPEIHISPDICADSPRPKKDTILLSKDGSVGIAYKVEEDLEVVTSSGILHLTVKDVSVLPDYLTLVLNSKIVRLQAERDAGGSIIQHWKQSEIERVRIPLLPLPRQRAIADKVKSSFALRAESKRLLDLAKHAVETAIEQGEDNAINVVSSVAG